MQQGMLGGAEASAAGLEQLAHSLNLTQDDYGGGAGGGGILDESSTMMGGAAAGSPAAAAVAAAMGGVPRTGGVNYDGMNNDYGGGDMNDDDFDDEYDADELSRSVNLSNNTTGLFSATMDDAAVVGAVQAESSCDP
jgi:hypothetical protein